MMKLADVVLYFVVFSFLGWVCETIFCSASERKFVYRGFLNSPVCPIYGFGGLIVVYILAPVKENLLVLFLLAMVFCTVLEYITSFILEKVFNVVLWDYSRFKFNINGRVCLWFSLMFGGLSLVAVRLIYPPVSKIVEKDIRPEWKIGLATFFATILITDTVITVLSMVDLNGKLKEIKNMYEHKKEEIYSRVAEQKQALTDKLSTEYNIKLPNIDAKIKELSDSNALYKMQVKRLVKAFPKMSYIKFRDETEKMKTEVVKKSKRK